MSTPRTRRRLATMAAAAMLATGGLAVTAAPAHAATFPPVGSTVCHSTPTTGIQCGTVVAVDVTVKLPGGPVSGLFQFTGCTGPAHVGARVFQGSQTVGWILTGGRTLPCYTYAVPTS